MLPRLTPLVTLASIVAAASAQFCRDGHPAIVPCVNKVCQSDNSLVCENVQGTDYCCTYLWVWEYLIKLRQNGGGAGPLAPGPGLPGPALPGPIVPAPAVVNPRRQTPSQLPGGRSNQNLNKADSSSVNVNCRDNGTDCPRSRHLCSDPLYFDLMTEECPVTCNRCSR